MALSDDERAVLDFERSWWTEDGAKDALIHERFGCSAEAYYQSLNDLLDRPEALEYDPLVVRRLRRGRERRRRARVDTPGSAKRPGGER
jgi:hypothetical protein